MPAGIDLIDASDADTSLLGHSYYGESLKLLSDMSRIIEAGLPPERRPGLRASKAVGATIWSFGL